MVQRWPIATLILLALPFQWAFVANDTSFALKPVHFVMLFCLMLSPILMFKVRQSDMRENVYILLGFPGLYALYCFSSTWAYIPHRGMVLGLREFAYLALAIGAYFAFAVSTPFRIARGALLSFIVGMAGLALAVVVVLTLHGISVVGVVKAALVGDGAGLQVAVFKRFFNLVSGADSTNEEVSSAFRHGQLIALMIPWFIAAVLLPWRGGGLRTVVFVVATIGLVGLVVLSLSRSALLVLAALFAVLTAGAVARGLTQTQGVAMAVAATAGIIGLVYLASLPNFADLAARQLGDDIVNNPRLSIVAQSSDQLSRHFWFGAGAGTEVIVGADRFYIHNFALHFFHQTGVAGLILAVTVQLLILVKAARHGLRALTHRGDPEVAAVSLVVTGLLGIVLIRMQVSGGGLLNAPEWVSLALALAQAYHWRPVVVARQTPEADAAPPRFAPPGPAPAGYRYAPRRPELAAPSIDPEMRRAIARVAR